LARTAISSESLSNKAGSLYDYRDDLACNVSANISKLGWERGRMKFDGNNYFEIEYQDTKTMEKHHWIHDGQSLQLEVGLTYIEVQRPTLK
jgi:hypothetical protein